MSANWFADIIHMHDHYGMTPKFREMDRVTLDKHLEFRTKFQEEEFNEQRDAQTAEDVVDALIDQIVVAIGTLHAFNVDAQKAWDAVLEANMNKTPGIKFERPNPLGLPDLIKPYGWVAPSHEGNHGQLAEVFQPAYGPCEV